MLLARARQDPALPRRTPANSNEPPRGWVPVPPARPSSAWLPGRLHLPPRFPGQEQIAGLVSQAIAVAEEAEEAAKATRLASRRATRGAAVAIVLGTIGAVVGVSAGLSDMLRPVPELHAAAEPVAAPPVIAVQPAPPTSTATEESATPASVALAPATFVRVLPATAAQPDDPAADVPPERGEGWGNVPGRRRGPLPQRRSS